MSSITDLLAAILAAKKGEEVRGSIHDAIEQCYEDGRAGVNDLQARQLIEAVAAVNEEQAAALEVLEARVEELESGEGGSSQQETTIDIPTVLVDGGVVENVSVNNNSTTTRHITFTTEFTEAPKVMVAIGKNVGAVAQYGYLSANILYPTVTTTGFDFFLANRTGSDRSPGVVWYAYQPTVKTIDLDITIPETEGMTEAEVREITGPIAAAVDALKTGYDGTTYQTAAEAVRTQINDLHVLIGDEPGTAISASAIGYGEESVEDALDGLNGRLEELEGGGTGGLTADVKAALLACFNHVAWDSDDPTGQSYISALQTALYPPANLSRITAVYTQPGTVYDTASLDSLRTNLVVTAYYDNSTSEVISNYTLSGTLTEGTSTITAAYGGKTATFTVTVTSLSEHITVSWSGSGAEKTSGIIDATAANVHWTLPFVEGYEGYASDATEDSDFIRISARLYSDAEATTLVGNWHIDNQTIEASGRTTINQPSMPVNTETMVAPAGYYVVLRANKRGGFTSNGTCGTFLNTYATDVKLMAVGGA